MITINNLYVLKSVNGLYYCIGYIGKIDLTLLKMELLRTQISNSQLELGKINVKIQP